MITLDVRTRLFEGSDVESAVEIESITYRQPWSAAMFVDELAAPGRTYMVGEIDDRLVGYGGVMVVGDEAHITTLVVAEQARQTGMGRRLMIDLVETAILAGARSLTLEVRPSNTPAQTLYGRFGLAPVGVRKRYYNDEDAVIMWVHDIDGPDYRVRLDGLRSGLGDSEGRR